MIVGAGLAGWMAAHALSLAVPAERMDITVIDLEPAAGAPPDADAADATLPGPYTWAPGLDLDRDSTVVRADGTFTFGVALNGWSCAGSTYFHPYSELGASLGPLPFHHIALRLREEGMSVRLANYALAALAAQANRFERPDRNPNSVTSTCRYGLHLDTAKLAGLLRGEAEAAGVGVIKSQSVEASRNERGQIRSLALDQGRHVTGELYLDCSGTQAKLISQLGDSGWCSWSRWLPCDQVSSFVYNNWAVPHPYSQAEALDYGWVRHLPLHGRTVLSYFHAGEFLGEGQAQRTLQERAGSSVTGKFATRALNSGRRQFPWVGNCIALGDAAAVIDPLGATRLHLLTAGIHRLINLLPGVGGAAVEAGEYNRQVTEDLDCARDFAAAHYLLNGRRGQVFWDAVRAVQPTDTLGYRIELYRGRGRLAQFDHELFEDASWVNLFDEHGLRPRQIHPMVHAHDSTVLQKHLERIREFMLGALRTIPAHADYLYALHGSRGPGPSLADTVTIQKSAH